MISMVVGDNAVSDFSHPNLLRILTWNMTGFGQCSIAHGIERT